MKTFSEAFPSLNTEGEYNSIFEMSQVERITAPPDMSFVKIYKNQAYKIVKSTQNKINQHHVTSPIINS